MLAWKNPAIAKWLEGALEWDSIIFEWGPGASTKFFLERAHTVHAVEHQQKYADELLGALSTEQKQKLRLRIIPATERAEKGQAEDPNSYRDPEPGSFRNYVQAVHDWPHLYDLIYVDGRARASCLRAAQHRVREGGWVLLHDAQRPEYRQAIALYDGWKGLVLPDPVMVMDRGIKRMDYRELRAWRKP